jgi:hypothetical protein
VEEDEQRPGVPRRQDQDLVQLPVEQRALQRKAIDACALGSPEAAQNAPDGHPRRQDGDDDSGDR